MIPVLLQTSFVDQSHSNQVSKEYFDVSFSNIPPPLYPRKFSTAAIWKYTKKEPNQYYALGF